MTLFEILLALAIFVGVAAALGQLISNGVRGAVQAKLQTQAILRCQSTMAELVAGVHPFQSAVNVSFPDDPSWHWTAEIQPSQLSSLYQVTLTVEHESLSRSAEPGLADVSFELTRLVRDPGIFLQAIADEQAEAGGSP